MHIIAFILALIAIVLFLAEYARSKAWLPLALALTVAAWMVQLVIVSGSKVTIN